MNDENPAWSVLHGRRALTFASAVLLFALAALFGPPQFVSRLLQHLPGSIGWLLLDQKLYGALAIVTFLEWVRPADRRQPAFGPGFVQDMLYFFLGISVVAAGTQLYVTFLNSLFRDHLGFLVIDASGLPWPAVLTISLLAGDLLAWFHHWVRHKVPWFWRFHTVHHSQREMNLFTDGRVHPLEFLIATTIVILPYFILGAHLTGRAGEIYWLGVVIAWYTRFYHANIRADLGWLRYVLVTPQSHRIHHSVRPEHVDKNFGVLFCIWDRIFGTHCDDACYPETGIADPRFPAPASRSPWAAVKTYGLQLVYPFLPARRDAAEEPAAPARRSSVA